MNKAQSAIASMVLIAGIVNAGGAVKNNRDVTYPIMGGFVVLVLLLALAEANEKVAEMFAGAYMITCLLTNGVDLFNGVSNALTSGQRFDPGPQSSPVTAGPTGTGAAYSTPSNQPRITNV